MRPYPGKGRGVRKWFAGLALLVALSLVALAVAAYALMPSLLEEKVARDLESGLKLSNKPEVKLKGDSTLDMLSGSFTGGRVVLKEPEMAGVRPERVVVSLRPFDLKTPGSLFGSPESEEPLSGDVRLALSEEEVERLLSSGSEEFAIKSVRLEDGGITLGSRVRFLGSGVPFRVGGDLRVRDSRLIFRARRVEAFGVDLSDVAAGDFLGGTEFSYPLKELPGGGEITSVQISDTSLVLSGRIENIPLG